jgi:phenylalanyl-tRNA synthetase beta chain
MKVSLNWLRELVELPASVPALVDLLTLAGVEVEDVETRGVAIENVVVAQINESVQHPNADRLSVCQVDDGSGTPRQIVCGAKNYKVGDKVPLALPGAVLPGDFKIKVGKLRGVESAGMLCSGKELGIPDDVDGLLILPRDAKVGAALSELYPADTILDLEVTPNRPDLLSHTGIAREIGALTGKTTKWPAQAAVEPVKEKPLQVAVETQTHSFYSALPVKGAKVASSPEWLRSKLEAVGLRAINNAVDLTNYVMMLWGQPAHVFDAAKVNGKIHVRNARDGEQLLALDGKTYTLAAQDLVIADNDKALAIAGVMGGEESGVTEATADIILEIAWFDPATVRRTARRLGLSSDSSYRFERGVDLATTMTIYSFAGRLLAELTGASAVYEPSVAHNVGEMVIRVAEKTVVPLRMERMRAIIGADIPVNRVDEILTKLGLEKAAAGWIVPSFRQDLTREIDLIEEITRVYGIENIPARETSRYVESTAMDRAHDRDMKLRRTLAALGFYEARTLSLTAETAAQYTNGALRVRNPLNHEQDVLRPNLLAGLLGVAGGNARSGNKSLRLFELGRVFRAGEREERTHLAIVMTGPVSEKSWRAGVDRNADIFDLKGVLAALGIGVLAYEAEESPWLALAAAVKLTGEKIGSLGQLWPAAAREMDIAAPVIALEIELPAPAAAAKVYTPVAKYPAVTRDIAMIAPSAASHAQIEGVLHKLNEPLLQAVELFDVFTDPSGEKVAAGQKSMAYSLTYRSNDRTLTVDEVNAAHARVKQHLKEELKVAFRE